LTLLYLLKNIRVCAAIVKQITCTTKFTGVIFVQYDASFASLEYRKRTAQRLAPRLHFYVSLTPAFV
jgi:hypothetical protein